MTPGVQPLFTVHRSGVRHPGVVATAIHAGHELRPEVAQRILVSEPVRRREEDPCTERIALVAPLAVTVHRSRFEVDLNRRREASVYERPDAAWGLELWARTLDADIVERSRAEHNEFYAAMREVLDPLARAGPFVVLDVHSYNHRREGPDAPPGTSVDNPEVNVGTGTLERVRWGGVVDRFIQDLERAEVAGHRLDVRENVRFRGGYLAAWVHGQYPGVGCSLALEFKKTFMDEWTGEVDDRHLDELARATTTTLAGLQATMDTCR